MTALTNDTNRVFEVNNDSNAVALAAGTKVFQGSLIGKTVTGYGRALEAGDTAMGFAKDNVDNTDGTDGEKIVEVKSMGKVSLFISGLTIADVGKDVYASDDNTFTLTSTNNSKVGKIIRFEKSDYAIVYFNFMS